MLHKPIIFHFFFRFYVRNITRWRWVWDLRALFKTSHGTLATRTASTVLVQLLHQIFTCLRPFQGMLLTQDGLKSDLRSKYDRIPVVLKDLAIYAQFIVSCVYSCTYLCTVYVQLFKYFWLTYKKLVDIIIFYISRKFAN